MAEVLNKKEVLIQNLRDAGCGDELIRKCMNAVEKQENGNLLVLLRTYRTALLGKYMIKVVSGFLVPVLTLLIVMPLGFLIL